MTDLAAKCRAIDLLVSDVDGVMTDGRIIYDNQGIEIKQFHVRDGVGEDEFVAMRTARDATLGMPTLILPSVQVNIRAGELPPKEGNGIAYLKIPVDAL